MSKENPQAEQPACGEETGLRAVLDSTVDLLRKWSELEGARYEHQMIMMQILNTKLDMLLTRLGMNVDNSNNSSHGNQESGE